MDHARICVGAFAGAFGVTGEVRLKSFTADPEAIGDYGPFYDDAGRRQFDVTILRPIKNGFAVRVAGVGTKEEADKLQGVRLFADREALPGLPDDEFYHTDLIGLEVVDTGGARLGTVTAVHNHGAGDLLEITAPQLKTPALVPFTKAVVPTVDLATGRIVVDPPEGIFGA
ncbi:MAG TPA: ribosome maturation factor RimM [Rhodobacterales bacterium]|nr:ribosome maturation factor RimM [Rhodobacterales bacterium]